MRYHFTSFRMALIKKEEINIVGDEVEKSEALCTTDGKQKWYSHYESEYGVPQNVKK